MRKFFKILGPGVITGAADDDPSGIGTYAQTGAQFGYGMLWTAVFMLPLQVAAQEVCARIGAVTGKGIAAVIRERYSKTILIGVVFLVLVANTINIGADIGAMAAAANLIVPVNFYVLAIGFTVLMLGLEVFMTYKAYAKILKWLALALFSYLITVFIVSTPWQTVLRATFFPHLEFNFPFLFIITGVLGTTISPYMFFWQASEETEEEKVKHLRVSSKFIHNLRLDNLVGMIFSELGTWSIIVVAATVLNSHGITNINSAAQAAKALEPLVQSFPNAGYLAKVVFAVGIIGLGLLSVPVLAGSAAYAFSEALNWREGLNLKFKRAHGFYGVIIVATLVGLVMNFVGIDPMKMLVYTAVINGVIAIPLVFIIWKIGRNKEIMGEYKSGKWSDIFVFGTFLLMSLAGGAMLVSLVGR